MDHIQEEKKTGEELLVFGILRHICRWYVHTRQWRRKSLYQKLLFAWLRTFWQMLLHFYDRIVTQVMYKNMYITTLLLAIQLAFEKCSVFLIEIRNLAIWWLRYHPKLYIPSIINTVFIFWQLKCVIAYKFLFLIGIFFLFLIGFFFPFLVGIFCYFSICNSLIIVSCFLIFFFIRSKRIGIPIPVMERNAIHVWVKIYYSMRAVISCGLYIFYPIFHCSL